ncbi:MAG: hypothetical protein ACKO7W_21495 [Elainella sp.]
MIAVQPDQHLRSVAPQAEAQPISESPFSGSLKADYLLPPSNLSMQCPDPPHLKYNITTHEGSVVLSIWEPAPKNDSRVKPFLFMSRHRLPSEREAKKLLAHYLAVYRHATHCD